MVKISAILLLLLALVCLTMADGGKPSTTGNDNGTGVPNGNSPSESREGGEVESSASNDENPDHVVAHNSTSSDDNNHTDDSKDDDSDDDSDDDYRPHDKYYHVRVIVVVSLEDIIALSNRTYELRHSLAEIFNISEQFISIHYRLHGLHDVSSELDESDDSSDDKNELESSDDKSNEAHNGPSTRDDKKFFEIIIDIRIPVEIAINTPHVTNSASVQTNMNATISNPQSSFSRALASSGAQPQSTATSKVTQVTPTNNTSSNSTVPPVHSSSTTSIISKTSGTEVVQASVMMMLAGLAALVL